MGKVPYVLECELFVRSEIKHAEELLAEYNDFYLYNTAQYGQISGKVDDKFGDNGEEIDEDKVRAVAEHNAKVSTEHFATLFGNKDFGESSLVGLRLAWYDLQQILLEEHKYKTPVKDSAMNEVAPRLRNVASVMLFAERIVSGLEKIDAAPEFIAPIKEGFELLLERCKADNFVMPEFHKSKVAISKFKKKEQYLGLCEELFFGEKR